MLQITDAESLRRSLDVIVPRRRPLSKIAQSLIERLREATLDLPDKKAGKRH
jgi:hypothetical protein